MKFLDFMAENGFMFYVLALFCLPIVVATSFRQPEPTVVRYSAEEMVAFNRNHAEMQAAIVEARLADDAEVAIFSEKLEKAQREFEARQRKENQQIADFYLSAEWQQAVEKTVPGQ